MHSTAASREFEYDGAGKLAQEYATWLRSALDAEDSALAANLCFLDVAVSDGSPTGFRRVLLSPGQTNQDAYQATIELLNGFDRTASQWAGECRSVRSHAVFQAGLPEYQDAGGSRLTPGTLAELRKCQESHWPLVEEGYLLWSDLAGGDAAGLAAGPSGPELPWSASVFEMDTWHSEVLRRRLESASHHPVQENWHIWTRHLADVRDQLRSSDGNLLAAVLGISVCIRASRPVPEQVGQMFIGASGPRAAEYTRKIARVICADLMHSWSVGRAKSIRRLRSRSMIAHRLPGIINMLMQQAHLQAGSQSPVYYQPQAAASLAMGRAPRWNSYEKQCREQGWRLTREVVENIWNDIAGPLAQYRVQTEPDYPECRQYWNEVPPPRLWVTGSLHFPEKELECSALISLCVPLLAEAYQHALIWAIKNRETNRDSPVVEIQISQDELSIDNVSATSARLPGFGREFTNQTDEIELIQSVSGHWNVSFPSADDVGSSGHWHVTCTRENSAATEKAGTSDGVLRS